MERTSVKISELSLSTHGDRQRLSALVDNDLLYLDFPTTIDIEARGEVFIAVALLEAMISNLPIELSDNIPISPLLLARLDELQDIYTCWNSDLHKIAINGGKRLASIGNKSVGCFYSGGVDGAYSFCKHRKEITHLVTLAGFDVIDNQEQWARLVVKNQSLADKVSVLFVDVNNNFRQFSECRKISNHFQHGLILAGIAVTLGFQRVYIPTGLTIDNLFPWSSHPLTDYLWGIENRQVIHEGVEMPRSSKVKFLANYSPVLDNLQVCWAYIDHNCGQCSKCLRTRANLHLLQLKCASLAPIDDINILKKMTITGISGLPVIEDLLRLAEEKQCSKEAKIFKGIINRYQIKYHAESLVKLLLGYRLKNLIGKLRGGLWREYRVTMESKKQN